MASDINPWSERALAKAMTSSSITPIASVETFLANRNAWSPTLAINSLMGLLVAIECASDRDVASSKAVPKFFWSRSSDATTSSEAFLVKIVT